MARFGRTYKMILSIGKLHNLIKIELDYKPMSIEYPITLDLSISRGVDSRINTGMFTLYGLSENTRDLLRKERGQLEKYIGVELWAGYETSGMALIFKGTVHECYSIKRGGETEWKTYLDCWDGGIGTYHSEVSQSFSGGTAPKTFFQNITGIMPDVTLGAISPYVPLVADIRGASEQGKAMQRIDEYCNGAYFIDLSYLYVMQKKLDALVGDIEEISLDDNLLSTPLRTDGTLTIETAFLPEIIVGQKITLKSSLPGYNGDYKVVGINHEGTISGGKNGTLTTTIQLFIGTQLYNMIKRAMKQ